jgi:hypothetical protein
MGLHSSAISSQLAAKEEAGSFPEPQHSIVQPTSQGYAEKEKAESCPEAQRPVAHPMP